MSEAVIRARSGEYELEQVRFLRLEGLRLTRLDDLSRCTQLVELSLAHNELAEVQLIGKLTLLERLDLSFNQLRRIDPLGALSRLRHLDLRSNLIQSIEDLKILSGISTLQALFLQAPNGGDQNPACASPSYRNQLFFAIPQLNILDGAHVVLISASEELEAQISSLRPDLSGYPKVEVSHWFSDTSLAAETVEFRNGRVASSTLPAAFLRLEDAIEELETSLPRLSSAALDQADIRLRAIENHCFD